MPTASVNGIELYYEMAGPAEAQPVVFLHGAGGNHISWWQQVPHFSRTYRCISIDHRGFGRSADPEGLGAAKFVDDLEALLAHLGVGRVALVAQSMGGRTALGFAVRHPERVRALVMADTWGFFRWPEQLERARVLREQTANSGDPLIVRAVGPTFRATEPVRTFLYQQIGGLNPPRPATANDDPGAPTPEQVAALTVPLLMIEGEEDDVVHPPLMEAFHALVPGSEYVTVPKAGHSVYFENARQFNDLVGGFLARHVGG
jgi:3-oxoadipate enol-lactonase